MARPDPVIRSPLPQRALRRRAESRALDCLSGGDPLNLVGTALAGDKVAPLMTLSLTQLPAH